MVRRIVRADVAADRAAVAHLHVGDLGADLAEDRPRACLGGLDDVGVGRHRAELERAVGAELDSAELFQIGKIDEHVGRRGSRFHHVDQRLAACKRARTVVLAEQAQGFLNARWACVLDLPKKHALFSAESPAQVKNLGALSRGSSRAGRGPISAAQQSKCCGRGDGRQASRLPCRPRSR